MGSARIKLGLWTNVTMIYLQKKAIEAHIPYSEAQLLELVFSLIRNTRNFEKALGEWNTKDAGNNIWDNFKSHFRAAQIDL